MTLHIFSCERIPAPKRCDVRVSKRQYDATHNQLAEECGRIFKATFPANENIDRITRHRQSSNNFRQRGGE
jgi:hypothetical protein